nr:MAG TPA: hypothetical protein [Caudoviricetes sp.]
MKRRKDCLKYLQHSRVAARMSEFPSFTESKII